jgi:hypothetical protein
LRLVIALAGSVLLAVAACGSDTDSPTSSPTSVRPPIGGPSITIADRALTVGPSPFIFSMSDPESGKLISGARPHLRFSFIDPRANNRKTYKAQIDAAEIEFAQGYELQRPDGTRETYSPGGSGVYKADIAFDSAGDWVADLTGDIDGQQIEPMEVPFAVVADLGSPGIAQPTPRSVHPVLGDVTDLSDLDSSGVPDPEMHQITIAEAADSGRPSVIVFAYAGLCLTDICGPLKELADRLQSEHAGAANFIHVEPYGPSPSAASDPQPLPWVKDEWGLDTEPAIFFLDESGIVRARLFTIASYEDLERSFDLVTAP